MEWPERFSGRFRAEGPLWITCEQIASEAGTRGASACAARQWSHLTWWGGQKRKKARPTMSPPATGPHIRPS